MRPWRSILFDKPEKGVGVLTLNRPEKLNALSTALLGEFSAALDAAEADPDVRVLILTGAGDKAFAAGADIAEYQGRREKAFMDFQFGGRRVNDRLEAFPKPTIAAVNGYRARRRVRDRPLLRCDRGFDQRAAWPARGAPRPLAQAEEERSASSARSAATSPPTSSSPRGASRASARLSSALRRRLCEPEALMETALGKARAMLKVAPLALAEMKRLVRIGADAALPTALALEQEVLFRLYCSADGQEGIDAFLEKRAPQFKGV